MDGVRRAADPYSRVRMAFGIQQAAEKRLADFRGKNTAHIRPVLGEIRTQARLLEDCEHKRARLADEAKKLRERKRVLESLYLDRELKSKLGSHFSVKALTPSKTNLKRPSDLMKAARKALEALELLWVQSLADDDTTESDNAERVVQCGDSPSTWPIREFAERLEAYTFDWYAIVFSDFDEDFEALRRAIDRVRTQFIEAARESIVAQARDKARATDARRLQVDSEEIALGVRYERLWGSLSALRETFELAWAERRTYQRRMRRSIEHGRRFRGHMQRAHTAAVSDATCRFHTESDPAGQFYRLMYKELIELELEKLMAGEEE